ncbi:argininosuccinate lyase [Sedimentisphaera salicampi]|uniref:Argininosuccinate lyase n=1 Tax=Sedimentisphaera salicampi TaxID=1941349 RepID=A0A1W6LNZ3_9BACT|nr:argininosuccinate lyase [Sedimentisphaera salicampi]ARN57456.1 Argininosuccinate lyase 1 [Sedimentisphaera salicampi]
MTDKQKSWQNRLENAPDELSMNFVESLSYDKRLYKYDIQGSIAHCEMLEQQGLISSSEREQIVKGLLEIQAEIEAGSFEFDVSQEDIHMAVEAALIEKTGDPGRKLHTGRSRNDQIATDMRLWMRDEINRLLEKLCCLQMAFAELAEKYTEDVMPSYTHLQRAQPIVIAAYLLSFVEQFERDKGRLKDLAARVNISPLGSGAAAGSTLPIDRNLTAEKLGFAGITQNSIDAVSDRDFCAEFTFACSMIMTHLSKLAEDFIIFSSTEFSFVKISDTYCTSSSMMPQKRNPDMLELIRGKTGNVFGSLSALMMMLKAQPSTYNRDLQEEKIHIFNAADYANNCLEMAAAIVSNTQFRTDKIASGIDEGFLDATSLAEYLVKKGVPFRQAHGIVGTAVALCEKRGLKLSELELEDFRNLSEAVEEDVYESLTAANVARAYTSPGAAGKTQSEQRIKYWKEKLNTFSSVKGEE